MTVEELQMILELYPRNTVVVLNSTNGSAWHPKLASVLPEAVDYNPTRDTYWKVDETTMPDEMQNVLVLKGEKGQ